MCLSNTLNCGYNNIVQYRDANGKVVDAGVEISLSNMLRTYEVQKQSKQTPASRMSRAEERSDMLTLSSRAKDYNIAQKALDNAPDIRADRVEVLKSQIDSGTYNVTGMDVANKLFDQL